MVWINTINYNYRNIFTLSDIITDNLRMWCTFFTHTHTHTVHYSRKCTISCPKYKKKFASRSDNLIERQTDYITRKQMYSNLMSIIHTWPYYFNVYSFRRIISFEVLRISYCIVFFIIVLFLIDSTFGFTFSFQQ